jgi:hypothetical protein
LLAVMMTLDHLAGVEEAEAELLSLLWLLVLQVLLLVVKHTNPMIQALVFLSFLFA